MADPQFIRSFKDSDGKTYDIPSAEAGDFLKEFPKAQEIHSFVVGKDTLDIPKEEVADFIKDMPEAKPLQNYDFGQPVQPVQPKPLMAEPEALKTEKPDHGYLMSNILQGITSTEKWIYDLPKLLYKTAALPFEGLADLTGANALRPPSGEQVNKAYEKIPGVGNISKTLGDYSDYLQKNIEADPDAKKDVIDTFTNGIKNGDIKEIGTGFKLLGGQLLQSLPSTILAGAAGMKAVDTGLKMAPYLKELAKSYAPLTAVFAEGKLDEIEKNAPDLPNAEKLTIAWTNGFFENLFERELGAGAVAQSLAGIIKSAGREEGTKIIKQGFKKTFAEMLTDKPWLAPFGEMFEEMGTQISENSFDKYFGYRPEMSLMDGVATAGLAGFAMGGAFGGVISGTKYGAEKVNEAAYNKRKSDLINKFGTHIDENIIPLIKHDTSDQIIEVNHQGKGWYVVGGDVNDPNSMLILANKDNPQERITPSRAAIDTKDILYIPTSEYRDSQLQQLKDQFSEVETKKKQKTQIEDHAASFTLGDPVTVPDGRTGKISRIEGRDQLFVTLDENEGKEVNPTLYNPSEIAKVVPPEELSTIQPVTEQTNEPVTNTNPTQNAPAEESINVGTANKVEKARLITDPNGIKRVDAQFDEENTANKVANNVRAKGKVSTKYEVTVDRVEVDPNDEYSDVYYTVSLRPKAAVVPVEAETSVSPTTEVTQEQVPKTSTPVEPVNEANVPKIVNISKPVSENVPEIKSENAINKTVDKQEVTKSLQKKVTPKLKKGKSVPKIQTEAYNLETNPRDVRSLVLKHFIGGGKINKSALQELFGTKNSTDRNASVESERKPRFTWVSDSEGSSIAQIAHSLWEEHGMDAEGNNIEGMSDQDFRNEVEDVIKSYSSPVQMAKDLLSTNKARENEFTDEQILEMEKIAADNAELSKEDITFEETAPQDDAEFLLALNKEYELSDESQAELNNLYHEAINQRTEVRVDQEGQNPESNGTSQGKNVNSKDLFQEQIIDLKKQRSLLVTQRAKKESAYNNRNGFGDTKAEPNDMFGGQGFDPKQIPIALKNIDDKISAVDREIKSLESQSKTAKKENAGQQTIESQLQGQDINLNPTEGQKEAGNYSKGHITVQGLNITIENPIGSVRKGRDEDGKTWEHAMKSHYGYFKQTEGKDGDHIDTFIGPNPDSEKVFVVDQINPSTGKFDESKVMIGYNTIEEAQQAYSENYDKNWKGLQSITEVDIEPFKKWLNDGKKQHKPFAEYKDTPDPVIIIPEAKASKEKIDPTLKELRVLGYSEEQINRMSPAEELSITRNKIPAPPVVEQPVTDTYPKGESVSPLEDLISKAKPKEKPKTLNASVFEPGTKVNTKFLGQPFRATVLDSPKITEGKLKVKSSDGMIYTVKVSDTTLRFSKDNSFVSGIRDLLGMNKPKEQVEKIDSMNEANSIVSYINSETPFEDVVVFMTGRSIIKDVQSRHIDASDLAGIETDPDWRGLTVLAKIYLNPNLSSNPKLLKSVLIHEKVHAEYDSEYKNKTTERTYRFGLLYDAIGKSEIERIVPVAEHSRNNDVQAEEYVAYKVQEFIDLIQDNPNTKAEELFGKVIDTVPNPLAKKTITNVVNKIIDIKTISHVINGNNSTNLSNQGEQSIGGSKAKSDKVSGSGPLLDSGAKKSVRQSREGVGSEGSPYSGTESKSSITHALDYLTNPANNTKNQTKQSDGKSKERTGFFDKGKEAVVGRAEQTLPASGEGLGQVTPEKGKTAPTHALDYLNGTAQYSRGEKPKTIEEKRIEQRAETKEKEWITSVAERMRRGSQDAELALKKMQEFIEKATGEKLPDHMNPYVEQDLESSKNAYAIKQLENTIVKPLVRAQLDLKNKYKVSDDEIGDYVMAKHAPERNRTEREKRVESDYKKVENSVATTEQVVNLMDDLKAKNWFKEQTANMSADEFRVWYLEKERARIEKKYAGNDYAGLTQWMIDEVKAGTYHPSNREELPENWSVDEFANFKIKQFEDKVTDKKDLKELWYQIKRLTNFSLNEDLKSRRINQQLHDFLLTRWEHYVPLRGFENITASDVFDYTGGETNGMIQPMKKIQGRTSKADDPFANMVSMAQSSIIQGNKNRTAVNALYMVRAFPQFQAKNEGMGLFRLAKTVWLKTQQNIDGKTVDVWVEHNENERIPTDEEFENGTAKRTLDKSDFELRRLPYQVKESEVVAYENGVSKVMYFASADVARSIKGTNKESREKVVKAYTAVIGKPTRIITRLWTTYSPKFILSNTPVDLMFAELNHMINKDGNFIGFNQALPGAAKVLSKYVWGGRESLDPKYDANGVPVNLDAFMAEFLEQGAETGFSHQMPIAQHRIAIGKLQRELNGGIIQAPKKVFDVMVDQIQHTAELSEGLSRLSTYIASRKAGKSAKQSAFDAHQITVDFTKSGKYTSMFSPLYGFFNVGFQSLAILDKLQKNNPKVFWPAMGALAALGYATAAALSNSGPDDDKDKSLYYSLSDYDRFNKFLVRNGDGFLVFTAPHGFRAAYALGVGIHDIVSGHKPMSEGILDISGNMLSTLSPINMQGSGMTENGFSGRFLYPTALQPFFVDLPNNSDAFGSRIYKEPFLPSMEGVDPAYTMSMPYVNPTLKEASRKWNNLWGGDDNRSMEIIFNPKTQEWEHNKLKGYMDWNPSKVEHVSEYIGGGAVRSFNELAKTVDYLIDKSKGKDVQLEPRSTPGLSTFYREPKSVNDIAKDYNKLKTRMQLQDIMEGRIKSDMIITRDAQPYIKQMSNSYTRRRLMYFDIAEKQLDLLNKSFKFDPAMKTSDMMNKVNEIKKTAVDAVEKIDKNLEQLYKTGSNEDTKAKDSADELLKYLHK